MLEIIKKDILQGLKILNFWTKTISERVKVEINILRVLSEIHKLTEKRDEILKKLGQETYQSWESFTNLQENEKILIFIRELKEVEKEIEEKKKKLSDLGDVTKWNL
jgi:nickel-dependent lactate racemase